MKASVHLGPNYNQHLDGYRNTNFKDLKKLFITQGLILEHAAENQKVSTIEWTQIPSNDWGRCRNIQEQTKNGQIINSENFNSPVLTENYLESMGNRLNIFQGLASLEIFQKIHKNLSVQKIDPQHFEGRIIFMSMFNDIEWTKEIQKHVFRIPDPAWRLVIPRPMRRRKMIRNAHLQI